MKKVVFCATVLLSGVAFGMGNLEEGRPLLPHAEQRVSSCNCYRVVAYTALTAVSTAAGVFVPWRLLENKLWMIAGGAAGAFVGGGLTWLGDRIYICCSSRKNRDPIGETTDSINDVPVVFQEQSDSSAGRDASGEIAALQTSSVSTDLVVHQGDREQADLSAEVDHGSVVTAGGGMLSAAVQVNLVVNNPTFLVEGGAALGGSLSPKKGLAQLLGRLSPNSRKEAVIACLGEIPSPDRRDVASWIYPGVQHFPLLKSPKTSGPCGEGVIVKEGAFDSEKSMVYDAVVEKTLFDGQLIYEGKMIYNQLSGNGCFTFNRGERNSWKIFGVFSADYLDLGKGKKIKVFAVVRNGASLLGESLIDGFGECKVSFVNPSFREMNAILVSSDKKQCMLNNGKYGVFFLNTGVYCGRVTLERGQPQINGYGTFFYKTKDGAMTTWTGNFKNGERHGVGKAGFDLDKIYIKGNPVTQEAFEAYKKEHPEEFFEDASVSSSAVETP